MKISTIFLGFLMIASSCTNENQTSLNQSKKNSNWEKIQSPIASSIRSLAESPNHFIYAGTTAGVYRSIDNAQTWEPVGLNDICIDEIIATDKGTLLVGSYRAGIFRSADGGETWEVTGLDKNVYIFSIVQDANGHIFASAAFISEGASESTPTGVFKSLDDGKTWHQTSLKDENIFEVSNPKPGLLFASSNTKFCTSTDDGVTWTKCGKGLPDSIPVSMVISFSNSLFASVGNRQDVSGQIGGGIFRSYDEGLTWISSDMGIDSNTKVSSLCTYQNTIFSSTNSIMTSGDKGIFKSTDDGRTWMKTGLNDKNVRFVKVATNGMIVGGTDGFSLYLSKDQGKSWQQTGKEFDNWETFRVTTNKKYLFAVAESGIWRSNENGKTWRLNRKDVFSDIIITSTGRLIILENSQVLASDDNGKKWYKLGQIETKNFAFLKILKDNFLVACTRDNGILYSTDGGRSWLKSEIPGYENATITTAFLTPSGSFLISGYKVYEDSAFIFRSTNMGTTWNKVSDSFYAFDFISSKGEIYVGTYAQGMYKSIDDGITWNTCNIGLRKDTAYLTITSLALGKDKSIICGTLGNGIFKSIDQGRSWQTFGGTDPNVWAIYCSEKGTLYAATARGIYKTIQ
jgi:photosystem II stability/assembly factor-like uncharacterized protein